MSVSFEEHLVSVAIRDLKRKMEGVGGKYLNPHEKAEEIKRVMEVLKKLRRQHHTKIKFFSSEEFNTITQGLEDILTQTQSVLNQSQRR